MHVSEGHLNIPKLRSEKSDIPNLRGRQPSLTENSVGLRIIEALGARSRSWLAREADLPDSTIGDAIKRGPSRSDVAVKIAAALGVTLDWLLVGRADGSHLMAADEAEWLEIAEFDLRDLTDLGFGKPVASSPIRRDWLYSLTRASTGLWLTRLLSDYQPIGLAEGALVICRSVSRDDLAEGHVCLWRIQDTIVVGRFSVRPDAMIDVNRSDGNDPRMLTPYLDPALGLPHGDLLVPPSAIDAGRYHLVGRVLGSMVRPL